MENKMFPSVQLLRLGHPKLPAASRSLSLSFSADPLISWLYKEDAAPWGKLEPRHVAWQQRRIEWTATKYVVAGATSKTSCNISDCPAMMILRPPRSKTLSLWMRPDRWIDTMRLLILDFFQNTEEQSINKKRAAIMFADHDKKMAKHADPNRCWYLEVIAVNPNNQGQGLGGQLMRWLLSNIAEDEDCILECTDVFNVPFYEKYGFRTVEEAELKDEADTSRVVKEFIMLRVGKAQPSNS